MTPSRTYLGFVGAVPRNALTFTGRKKKKKKRPNKEKGGKARIKGKEISIRQSDAPWQIIYGTMKTGGVYTFGHTIKAEQKFYAAITLAGHAVSEITTLYLDDKEVTLGGPNPTTDWSDNSGDFARNGNSKVKIEKLLGGGPSGTLSFEVPSLWTLAHQQLGRAYVVLVMIYNEKVFPEGLPDPTFLINGKSLYDPRTSSSAFSDNAALCALDYLINTEYGLGATWPDDFDTSNWEDAADICDESVALAAGGTESRYTINGAFDVTMSHEEVLREFAFAMAGSIAYFGGKWRCFPGKWRTPVMTIDESMIVSVVSARTKQNRNELFNAVKGVYVSPEANYEVTDFPEVTNSTYETEDGRRLYEDVSYPFTHSPAACQRLAKIELERVRQGAEVELECTLAAYQLQYEDNVYLTLDKFGWSSKTFNVEDVQLRVKRGPSGPYTVVRLLLRETASGIFTWSAEETTVDLSANTTLPDPFDVEDLAGLVVESGTDHLIKTTDGTIITRLNITWTAPTDVFISDGGKIELQYKLSSASRWLPAGFVDGGLTEAYISPVQDGVSYDVRARFINGLGATGDWAQNLNHSAVGKTEPPSNVSGFAGTFTNGETHLSWTHISDVDLSHYKIKRGSSWAAGTLIADGVVGNSYIDTTLMTAGSNTYWIKAVDTSGNESASATSVLVNLAGPNEVNSLMTKVIDNNVLIDWTEPNASSLPVSHYKVYRGATFAGATLIGVAYGTFHTWFTDEGGAFTFWVTAVDIGGNEGPELSKGATLYPPPDYVLQDSGTLNAAGASTLTNALESITNSDRIIAPCITGETWQQHFTNNSWSTPQDQVSAGYPIFIQPSNASDAVIEWEVDLGAVVAGSRINLSYSDTLIDGGVTVTPQISYKENSGDSWTDGTAGDVEIYATNFRYMKFRFDVAGDDQTSLVRLSNIQYRVETKEQTDAGRGTSSASLATTVNFNLAFLDVNAITVTPKGTSAGYMAVWDFTDVPNPTSFDVYIFDKDGNQVAVDFSWNVRGTINPI